MNTKMASSKESLSVINMETLNMSSTAQLTDKKSVNGDEYNPFEHRNVEHPTSDMGTMVHLLKSSLGTGVLAMPLAFKNGGVIFGSLGTAIVGLICTHCVYILVQSSQDLCRRQKVPSLGFSETAEAAFMSGPPGLQKFSTAGRKFVNGALLATYYSALCVYVVFVASSIKQVGDYYMDYKDPLDVRVYIPMLLVFLIPLGLIRDLKYLVPFSAIANVFILVSFSITLYYVFNGTLDVEDKNYIARAEQLPLFFATVIFAMEGIGVVMPLENSMKNPRHFIGKVGILNIAMFIVVLLYGVIGLFGYLKYGDAVEGSITLNLPDSDIPAQVVKVLYAVAILFSYGLQFYIPTSIAWPDIEQRIPKGYENIAQTAFRIGTIICTVAIAVAVPNLGPIISLVGAICFSTLGLFCPAVIETVTYWETGLGWRLWKNLIIIVFAMLALITGSYASILEIIHEYSKSE
ncbi:proton-coupled amino acid transporter-like protein CG1139 [Zootermopsis nevadensis]|uniref:Proton-coupled amino acid transporter 4 n=1 Tax=Zootermopsis nevadensis TaxID=136037 RepID=A0A067RHJ6_ZOONE|nr:proton-coupled amino acid transporter-like protein CG1139 [Zootermopsis nevadensis]XP_021919142.1 proton-coupled amino acid transporter-like protein CG1139 [Zootermopsis nevadensis]KDR19825.1 Proton-coupled amino acid transporter 4 [Zootermopsis nevadensis]